MASTMREYSICTTWFNTVQNFLEYGSDKRLTINQILYSSKTLYVIFWEQINY